VSLLIISLCALAAILAVPGEALAWGPGVHTAAARFVLANLDLVPPAVAALIAQFPNTYLYGCLSADFFVGKGSRIRPGHSHNWESSARLALAADCPQLGAHALGYMSHLAADVVAHNVYVPGVMVRTPIPSRLAHAYVEAQADQRLTGGHGLRDRLSRPSQRIVDKGIVSALDKNAITYQVRKRVFTGSVALAGLRGWNRSLRFAQRMLPLPEEHSFLADMFELSLRAVLDVLNAQGQSAVLAFDPIGSLSLKKARKGGFDPVDPRLLSLPPLPTPAFQEVA